MAEEEDTWVFDGLVQFLKGPIWDVPIMTFIENRSTIFFRGVADETEYRKIHQEYKNLVDLLLGTCLDDMNISPKLFELQCGKESKHIKDVHQSLFQQVWAAEDYEIFKSMMIQKNLELTMQTIDMIKKLSGGLVILTTEEEESNQEDWESKEQKVMSEVIRRSLEEYKALEKNVEEVEKEIAKALEQSMQEGEVLEAEHEREKQHMKEVMDSAGAAEAAPTPPAPKPELDPEDLRQRQEYLRKQRDKLLELKRLEREKALKEYEQTEAIRKRPKSSRAARSALTNAPIDPQKMQFRKALAEKLKQNVINK